MSILSIHSNSKHYLAIYQLASHPSNDSSMMVFPLCVKDMAASLLSPKAEVFFLYFSSYLKRKLLNLVDLIVSITVTSLPSIIFRSFALGLYSS